MNILVVGLGKLGLPLAVFLKSKEHKVWGHDVDQERLLDLISGTVEHWEPGCGRKAIRQLTIANVLKTAVKETDMAFICAQTPIKGDGTMDTSFVNQAVNDVVYCTAGKPYTIVMASTVMPGTCAAIQAYMPENVRIVSMPVWIAMGSVLKDLENPPGLVIGCDCKDSGWSCSHFHQILDCWEPTPILASQVHQTDTRTAEFIKLAHNAWCCIKMSWLGNIGDQAKDLDIDVNALSAFMQHGGERPGAFWKYGPSFGGPCFPRDLRFWLRATEDVIGDKADHINEHRLVQLATKLIGYTDVCLVGEGYKKDVPVDEASVSLALAQILTESHLKQNVTFWPEGQETAQVFVRMHDDDTTAFPLPNDGRPIMNTWRMR